MNHTQTAAFLKALAAGSTVSEAADAAGISSSTAYNRRKTDADFAEAWKLALEDSADVLEREARRRAIEGVEETVIYQGERSPLWVYDTQGKMLLDAEGKPVQEVDEHGNPRWLTVRKPSDSLLALLLKGRRKDVFSDRTELTGADGGALVINPVARRSRLETLAAMWAARQQNKDLA